MLECGLTESDISVRSVQRFFNQKGYRYLQARRKGLLKRTDLRKRLMFAKDIKKQRTRNFWTKDVMFYFNGTGFVHKRNPMQQALSPKGRIWRKPSEALQRVRSYGKGVVLCKSYKKLDGPKLATFVRRYFPRTMKACGTKRQKIFLQDGDPSRNSIHAKAAFADLGLRVLKIPPRSPDLNPIENFFHIASKKLCKDALEKRIQDETFRQFKKRAIRSLKAIPKATIDKIIFSMDKRVDMLISNGGNRLKY
ncbi:Transposable element Tc1 transposase [Holothuria leucospilota]|uniref:Transposable element Tc1 transposase n=1 Tax=Holothuria leucospilota TaxID=206669 RepID=A0A9Q1BWH4_HOLLE|nr:Transposable element Tc1 transposase [Holothuria leucospilota]